jgi:hypothetical protein
MHEIRTEIDIDASPARVWNVLADFPSHASWNPFVRSIAGMPEKGRQLVVNIQPPGGKGMTFKPTILVADSAKELRWLGRFLVPGLFDGEHYFEISPRGHAGTKFIHGEKFSGVLVSFAKASLDGGTRAGFIAMNKALKARAEASPDA